MDQQHFQQLPFLELMISFPRFELGGIPPAPRGQPQIEVRKLGGCE